MSKNASTNLIDELYLTTKDKIHQKNFANIQSCLNQIDNVEEKFIQTYTKKKKEGGYYTAEEITQFMISKSLISLINKRFDPLKITTLKDLKNLSLENRQKVISLLSNITVCDPSCGSGAFLVNSAKIIANLFIKLKYETDDYEIIEKIIENINGYDLNENAVKLCRLKLYRWFFERKSNDPKMKSVFQLIEDNIKIKDSLTQPISLKFDIIIGNPPYGNILDQHQKVHLKKTGTFHKEIYCAFLLKALEWSNGIIGFLVPKSFLLRQSYIDFRTILLERANLLKIYDIGPNIFKTATNEVQILLYEKRNSKSKNLEVYNNAGLKLLTYDNQKFDSLKFCNNPKCPLNNKPKKIYVYSFNDNCPYCNFKTKHLNRIRIKPSSSLLNIIDKIEKNSNLNYLNVQDFPRLIRGEEDKGLRAVKGIVENHLYGSCIFLNAKNDFMHYHYQSNKSLDLEKINPKILKGDDYEYYIKPKLLIKHNTIYPVALYTEKSVCFTSSIYSLLHDDIIELKFLCTLINSCLIKFYCIYGINNQINTTINLNQYMIRHIPVPKVDDKIKHDLAAKADLISKLYKNPQKDNLPILDLEKEIDDVFFQLYGIKNEDKSSIFKSILE